MRDDNLIYTFIIELTLILERDWEEKVDIVTFIVFYKKQDHKPANSILDAEIDSFQILGTSIQKANTKNLADFLSATQLNVQEPKTYK